MPQTTSSKNKSKARPDDDESESSPSMDERRESGMRIAEHFQKAAGGGKIRKVFSLWRISKELPTVAAGAGEVLKRHPIPVALIGGAATAAAILYAAHAMGAFDGAESSDDSSDESSEESSDESEGDAEDESDGDEAERGGEDEGEDEDD